MLRLQRLGSPNRPYRRPHRTCLPIVVVQRHLGNVVIVLAAVLLVLLFRLLALFLPHEFVSHFVGGKPNDGGFSDGFKLVHLCAYLYADAEVVRSEVESIFGEHECSEFALVIFEYELPGFFAVLEGGVDSGDGDIFGDPYVDVLLASDVDPILLLEGDELKYFALLLALFLHDLQHDVRLLRLWDVYGIELLVVQVNSVLVVGLAHLAA